MIASGLLIFAAFLYGIATPAPAPPTPSPNATTVEPVLCLARLDSLVALDADSTGLAHSYLLTFAPTSGKRLPVSGTISLFDASSRWDVPFSGAVAAYGPDAKAVVVHFSESRDIETGRVASLSGPLGGKCYPISVPATVLGPTTQPVVSAPDRTLAKTAITVQAPEPAADPAPSCADPNKAARVTSYGQGDPIAYSPGDVSISVSVDDDGGVYQDAVYKSSGSPLLDVSAIQTALRSTYAPATHGCRPVAGTYIFRVVFRHP